MGIENIIIGDAYKEYENLTSDKKVPCKYCGTPTGMIRTELCDNCWEIQNRLEGFISHEKARDYIVKQMEKYGYEIRKKELIEK